MEDYRRQAWMARWLLGAAGASTAVLRPASSASAGRVADAAACDCADDVAGEVTVDPVRSLNSEQPPSTTASGRTKSERSTME